MMICASQVSILVFVEVALGLNAVWRESGERKVSILVFVEVALGLALISSIGKLCIKFQSLFSWKSPSDQEARQALHRHRAVSILVFVEVALGLNNCSGRFARYKVSILVFVEVALGRGGAALSHACKVVSILVFVEVALGP